MKLTQEQIKQATEEVQKGRATDFYSWIDNFGTKNLIRDIYRNDLTNMEELLDFFRYHSTEEEKINDYITYFKHNRKRILLFPDPKFKNSALILELSQLEDTDVASKLKIFTKYGYTLQDNGNTITLKKKGKESGLDFQLYVYNTEVNEILKRLPEFFRFNEIVKDHCELGKYSIKAIPTTRDIIQNNIDIINIYTSFYPEEKQSYEGFVKDLEESLNTDLVFRQFKNYVELAGSKANQRQRFEETLGIKIAELTNPEDLKEKKLVEYQRLIQTNHTPEALFVSFKMANMVDSKANQILNLASKLR